MAKKEVESDKRTPGRFFLLVAMGAGIALFAAGFVLAVTSLSEPESASASGDRTALSEDVRDSSLSLMVGLLLSLSGVVLATATPAVFFIKGQRS